MSLAPGKCKKFQGPKLGESVCQWVFEVPQSFTSMSDNVLQQCENSHSKSVLGRRGAIHECLSTLSNEMAAMVQVNIGLVGSRVQSIRFGEGNQEISNFVQFSNSGQEKVYNSWTQQHTSCLDSDVTQIICFYVNEKWSARECHVCTVSNTPIPYKDSRVTTGMNLEQPRFTHSLHGSRMILASPRSLFVFPVSFAEDHVISLYVPMLGVVPVCLWQLSVEREDVRKQAVDVENSMTQDGNSMSQDENSMIVNDNSMMLDDQHENERNNQSFDSKNADLPNDASNEGKDMMPFDQDYLDNQPSRTSSTTSTTTSAGGITHKMKEYEFRRYSLTMLTGLAAALVASNRPPSDTVQQVALLSRSRQYEDCLVELSDLDVVFFCLHVTLRTFLCQNGQAQDVPRCELWLGMILTLHNFISEVPNFERRNEILTVLTEYMSWRMHKDKVITLQNHLKLYRNQQMGHLMRKVHISLLHVQNAIMLGPPSIATTIIKISGPIYTSEVPQLDNTPLYDFIFQHLT